MTDSDGLLNAERIEGSFHVKFKGKEVQNPILRTLLGLLGAALALIGAVLAMAAVALSVVLLPVIVPVHYLLRWRGRKGFLIKEPDGRISIDLSFAGFHKL
ncbi:MAG: hypothetical protein JWS12_980 [Candidatus Saccharibacteria bacterium]|nr:hypothetical protein [Candidatus Saccharibacteria bacterium]